MKHHLYIDIETRSGADIAKTGLYRYAQDPDFGILLLAYKWDREPVEIIDLAAGESVPDWIQDELISPDTVKHAYNAAALKGDFELVLSNCVYIHCQPIFQSFP